MCRSPAPSGCDRRRLRHDTALVVGHRNREAAPAAADLLDLFHQRIEVLRLQPLLVDREGHESQQRVRRAGREERVRDDLVGRPVDRLLQHDERRRRRRMLPDGRDESGQRGRVADQHHRERVVRRGPRLPRRRAIRAVEHVGRPRRRARCASTARTTRDTGNRAKVRAATWNMLYGGSSSRLVVLNGTMAVIQAPFMSALSAARTSASASLARRSRSRFVPLRHSRVAT